MKIENRKLSGGVSLGIINTDKFKNNYFALNFLLPISAENIAEGNVLARVLFNGTKKHPSVSSLSKHIGMLYDPTVEISSTKYASAVVFRVSAFYLADEYLPKNETLRVFSEVTSLLTELLTEPITKNGALSEAFTEREKKHQVDRIRAQINNKDSYALNRCATLMLGDIPAALDALGTEETVSAITARSLYEKLHFILNKCPVEAVFAGKFTEDAESTALSFLSSLLGGRDEGAIIPYPKAVKPTFSGEVMDVTEDISANQGRMIMGFSMPESKDGFGRIEVFNDIFGGSPVSRLFANVRERLNLCYYCSSTQNYTLNVMYVRSGISPENLTLAREEIMRQLELLKDPENISEEELSAARLGIVSAYNSVCDSPSKYASWYITRRILGRDTDIEKAITEVKNVDARAVAEVAQSVRPVINYFLNGTEV